MRFFTNLRFISAAIAVLVVILIGLTFRLFSDNELDAKLPLGSAPAVTNVALVAVTEAPQHEQFRLLAICSGMDAVVEVSSCRKRFEDAGNALSLGENIIFIPSISVSADNLQFSINGDSHPISFSDIEALISGLEIGVLHSVRIRQSGEPWSNPISFEVSYQPPGTASIYGVCADLICAPAKALTSPLNADSDSFYPLVELVAGLTDPPTEHMWIELMLNADDSFIGCLNCQAAEAAEFIYDDRKEFGVTGIFYNWDLKNLPSGTHKLQARLRNRLYLGDWSAEFSFEVQRP